MITALTRFISSVLPKGVRKEKWLSIIWYKPCFDFCTLQSDSRYGAPCSWVSVTPVVSPTPTPAQAQRAEDQASSGGTCCKFFSAHASSTWRIARQQGLPRYHHLKEHWAGATRVGGLNVWQMRRQGVICVLLRAIKRKWFSVRKLCATLVSSTGFIVCYLGQWTMSWGSVEFFSCQNYQDGYWLLIRHKNEDIFISAWLHTSNRQTTIWLF